MVNEPTEALWLTADRNVCAGAGQCVRAAPDLFDQDEDGLVELLRTDVPPEERENALTAADWCPSGAVAAHRNPPGPGREHTARDRAEHGPGPRKARH